MPARDRLLSLVQEADALIESNRPGVMERLGVGPELLRRASPHLTYVRIAGYRDPKLRQAPGHDLTYLACSGLLSRLDPAWKQVQLSDLVGAFWAALATLEGLRQRGGFYEVYLDEACGILGYPPLPVVAGTKVCYCVYPCREGEIALAAIEPHFWAKFCRAMQGEEWMQSAFTPVDSTNPVYESISSIFARRTAPEWGAWALEMSIPLRAVRVNRELDVRLPWRKHS